MKEKDEAQKRIKFRYIFPDQYNPVFANGAYGGVTPQGEIVVNFYLERSGLPHSVTHVLNPDSTLGKEVEKEPQDVPTTYVRFVTNGVVLTVQGARAIHQWLGQQIEKADKRSQLVPEAEAKEGDRENDGSSGNRGDGQ